MSQPDPNPYASPDEKNAPLTLPRGSALFGLSLANAAFVFALVGPPIAFICGMSGIALGFWDWLGRFIPLLFVLLLYFAAGWVGILGAYGSVVAAIICLILGNWSQRVAVVLTWIAYLVFVLFILPLLRL